MLLRVQRKNMTELGWLYRGQCPGDGAVERAASWGWGCREGSVLGMGCREGSVLGMGCIEDSVLGWGCIEGSVLRMGMYTWQCPGDGAV